MQHSPLAGQVEVDDSEAEMEEVVIGVSLVGHLVETQSQLVAAAGQGVVGIDSHEKGIARVLGCACGGGCVYGEGVCGGDVCVGGGCVWRGRVWCEGGCVCGERVCVWGEGVCGGRVCMCVEGGRSIM